MTERGQHRRPATFKLDDPSVVLIDGNDGAHSAPRDNPSSRDNSALRGKVQIATEAETQPPISAPVDPSGVIRRKGFRWGTIFWSAFTGLVSLAFWLWVSRLIGDLFAQSQTLGTIGFVLAALAGGSLAVIIGREAYGLIRLAKIEQLHARAATVLLTDNRAEGRAIIRELLKLEHTNPQLARARATLTKHIDDIIDGADLIRLAERELLTPLDQEARALISKAAQRVSLVTAISPKALIDVVFVLIATVRLVGQLARLYGGRPGAIGMIKLMRQTISHLAITGGIAIGDSVVQQLVGHGLAAKLSSKLGEGMLNGMLTARLGLAAIDLTRPLPFNALPRPALGDLVKDLARTKRDKDE
ncbi:MULTISPECIES: TIGR01620 family protein [Rhodopseudomonas]|uniref:Membrane protein n=1 Tax=Rhodopseudomonas palustris TaxID=1076 RepID=A0A0D7EJE0_RHOPL|nr:MULTISPECIES: TIGR01620 family protein [Rhodopseudomonas]KIZ40893.1 membrane protein [Rhodopseudomonas palustris]MDF3812765.1 TIGR01620 family protein [Rhodopseudomonas sp. BAL398]WOK20349.1 TIGR01620 family protein [Rhodopseudomonas sp. BAL398]